MSRTIALISDIHANLPALQAVWQHATSLGAQEIWNMGDHVGYSPYPLETVHWLQQHHAISVLGDYDLRVLQAAEKRSEWGRMKHPVKLEAILWARKHLTNEGLRYLEDLPRSTTLERDGFHFVLNHGSPDAIDEGLAPSTPLKRLRKLAAKVEADAVLSGDSHRPFVKQVGDVTFVNPGSVGRPDDGDPRASYGLLQLDQQGFAVKLFRVEYEVARTVAAMRQAKLPEEFAQMMLQGRSFDDIDWPN